MTYYNYLGVAMPESQQANVPVVSGTSAGDEVLYAAPGPSILSSEGGPNDTLVGNNGDITFYLGNPTDVVQVANGSAGIKTIVAYSAYILPANIQNLTFFGGQSWGAGNNLDNLIVMGGNDVNFMDGGPGNDVLVGGYGQNNFGVTAGNGNDVIYNFHTNQDTLRMPGTSFTSLAQIDAAMTQTGPDVVLKLDATETLTFRGHNISDFQASDFLLPLDRSHLGPLTFDDEFNTLQTVNSSTGTGHWQTNLGGSPTSVETYQIQGNQEAELYTDPNFRGTSDHALGLNPFSVRNGLLTITAQAFTPIQAPYTWGQQYSSGMLTTKGVFMQRYGYFEMRAQFPDTAGTWPAFWLSQDPFQQGAEADIVENLGGNPHIAFSRAYYGSAVHAMSEYMENPGGFHTYGMLWTPTLVDFYIDDVAVMEAPTPQNWDKPMYLILNMALGGWGGQIGPSTIPAQMTVDYVRVYGLADGSQITENLTPAPPPTAPVPTPQPVAPAVSTSAATYVAPAGVTDITLTGHAQAVTGNNAGDTFHSNDTGNTLAGGTGNDTFYLGRANDQVTGGGGADSFIIAPNYGRPTIMDFSHSQGDVINLDNLNLFHNFSAVLAAATQVGGDTVINIGSGGALTLHGVQWVSLTASDFGFTSGGSGASPSDFDGDGRADILWRNDNGQVAVWKSQGGSTSSAGGQGLGAVSSDWHVRGAADFDGDRRADILWQNDSGAVAIWESQGGMASSAAGVGVGAVSADWHIRAAADFDGDGRADILWENGSGALAVWNSQGATTSSAGSFSLGSVSSDWHIRAAGDFDGDGKADILWQNDSGVVAAWNSRGGTTSGSGRQDLGAASSDWHIKAAADFDGDGKSDILWQNDNGAVALWTSQSGEASSANGVNIGSASSDWHIQTTADLNGDGKADIVWRNDNGAVAVWESQGGVASSAGGVSLGSVSTDWHIKGDLGLAAGSATARSDFDGDGKSDILWRNDNGGVAIWNSQGGMTSGAGRQDLGAVSADWHIQSTGDFDGDGKSDILWRNDNGVVAAWDSHGGMTSGAGRQDLGSASSDWHILSTADFNGDGRADILWRNDSGAVALWESQSGVASSATGVSLGSVSSDWHIRAAGDFDGDGKADVLWQNDSGVVAAWNSRGGTTSGSGRQDLGAVSSDWHIKAAADFDGDGKSDILWQNENGAVALWTSQSGEASSANGVNIGSASTDWHIQTTADLNGDGKADLVWRNDNGAVAVWESHGGVASSAGGLSLGNVSTDWHIMG